MYPLTHRRCEAFDPESQAHVTMLLGFIQCSRREEVQPYLDKHGLTHIDPQKQEWYPLQTWLDVLNDILADRSHSMFDMVSVGMKIGELAPMPPQLEGAALLDVLLGSNIGYQSNHRGNVGEMKAELVGPNHIKLAMHIPYPDDLMYGVNYGLVRRYLPKGSHVTLKYDDTVKRRDLGGDVTVIDITWS